MLTHETTVRRRAGRAGFTLIEFLAAISILFTITAIFLPAVQRQREAANRAATDQNLRRVAATLDAVYRERGALPASLGEILNRAFSSGLTAANVQVTGKDGYRFAARELTATRACIVGEPIPGVTGAETGVLEVNVIAGKVVPTLRFIPTPGAAEGRRRMFAALSEHTGRALAMGLDLLPAVQRAQVLAELRKYNETSTADLQAFDAARGIDGSVALRSIRDYLTVNSGSARPVFTATWQDFHRELRLGAYGENWVQLPGITGLPAVQSGARYLNFSRLADLTRRFAADLAYGEKLVSLLGTAAVAESAGDLAGKQKVLGTYLSEVQAQQTRHFTVATPEPLIGFLDSAVLLGLSSAMLP